ncbi:MAG: thioesterase family protein [Cyanobacteria bacterium P01_G01_bin.19]
MLFQYSRRIYLGDTDAAGVVYFARGMELCHEAYEEFLAEGKIDLKQMLAEKKIALPIVRAEIDFLRPLFCSDRITINLSANSVGSSDFALDYRVFTAANLDKVAIEAKTFHVCIDPERRSRVDLPPAISNLLKAR